MLTYQTGCSQVKIPWCISEALYCWEVAYSLARSLHYSRLCRFLISICSIFSPVELCNCLSWDMKQLQKKWRQSSTLAVPRSSISNHPRCWDAVKLYTRLHISTMHTLHKYAANDKDDWKLKCTCFVCLGCVSHLQMQSKRSIKFMPNWSLCEARFSNTS